MDKELLADVKRMCEIIMNNNFGHNTLDSLAWYVSHHPDVMNIQNTSDNSE